MSQTVTREACFACTTPYQIMGAISIVTSRSLEADLYLFGMFEGYEEVAGRLEKAGVFDHVYVVSPDEYKTPGRQRAFKQMLQAGSVARKFVPEKIAYRHYYASSRAHVKNILLHELLRRNKAMSIVIYDDGMGTYARDSHVLNTTSRRRFAERLLGWDMYTADRLSFEVYEPELFEKPAGLTSCEVSRMPKPFADERAAGIIKQVFGVTPQDAIDAGVIIFDPLRGVERERDEKLKVIDQCYDLVAESFGEDNVVIKPHPRSTKVTEAKGRLYQNAAVPMEALYAEMADIRDRILITYASSAVYTPKLLWGEEPVVILLFRLTDGEESEWSRQYTTFKSAYADQHRIMAPETMEEFRQIVGSLLQGGFQ